MLVAAVALPCVDVGAEARAATAPTSTGTGSGSVAPGAGLTTASAPATAPTTSGAAAGSGGTIAKLTPARVRAKLTRFSLSRATWPVGGKAPVVRFRIDARRRTVARVQLRYEDRSTRKLVLRQDLGTVRSGTTVRHPVHAEMAGRPGRYRVRVIAVDTTGHRARRRGAPASRNLRVREKRSATEPATPKATPGPGGHVFPVQGRCNFRTVSGQRFQAARGGGRAHNGHDIGTFDAYPPAVAYATGTVSRTWWDDGGGGWTLVIDGDDGRAYGYLHLKPGSIVVKAGQRVTAGQHVADVGRSGGNYDPHLHFEIRPIPWADNRARAIDPLPLLAALPHPCVD
ncbi:MAG: murein hydrolase activator EnvC [Solirubrobacteraceae bacterium]